jgi:2-dehydro-3-deoxy-D-arabinonate dehydratase
MPRSPLRLFATSSGLLVEAANAQRVRIRGPLTIDMLFQADDPLALAAAAMAGSDPAGTAVEAELRAPLVSQEVWAAGVTYYRSRTARMAEAKDAGGGSFYDRVYEAERPELFFKATPHRVVGHGGRIRIRADSKWNVPEPELTLAINSRGRIFGYTIGDDVSSRDIEGENPLYLPQAKAYLGAAALGPSLLITDELPAPTTTIALEIRRAGQVVFTGETNIGQIKRPLPSLADWLFRENAFPAGCYLMTGTGIVPPDAFTLHRGDEVRITIEPVGTLSNVVA